MTKPVCLHCDGAKTVEDKERNRRIMCPTCLGWGVMDSEESRNGVITQSRDGLRPHRPEVLVMCEDCTNDNNCHHPADVAWDGMKWLCVDCYGANARAASTWDLATGAHTFVKVGLPDE